MRAGTGPAAGAGADDAPSGEQDRAQGQKGREAPPARVLGGFALVFGVHVFLTSVADTIARTDAEVVTQGQKDCKKIGMGVRS